MVRQASRPVVGQVQHPEGNLLVEQGISFETHVRWVHALFETLLARSIVEMHHVPRHVHEARQVEGHLERVVKLDAERIDDRVHDNPP